jgi:hypothetical protein
MRADEKIDAELEREVEFDAVVELDEEHAPEQARAEEVDTSTLRFHELIAFVEGLLRGDAPELELAWASETERQAIALLREAIEGRKPSETHDLFAEDRLQMLNQALAALQPTLAAGFEQAIGDERDLYRQLVEDMHAFQHDLSGLEDAQEEVFEQDRVREMGKPIDTGEVGDDRPTTLAGPGPAIEPTAAATTLTGPGPAVEKPSPPTTLTGPGPAVEKPSPPSAAWDGEPGR